jgi:hypothetical protein
MASWPFRHVRDVSAQANTDTRELIDHQISHLKELGRRLGNVWADLLSERPPRIGMLRLDEVIKFFAENRPKNSLAAAGAVLRRRQDSGYLVHLLFLDLDGNPLISGPQSAPIRSYTVTEFDDDLASAFGDNDLVLLS